VKAPRVVLRGGGLLLSLVLMGCATTAPYIDALHRFGSSGRAIQKHLKPAGDPSVEALYESFDAALSEAEKAK
jgi:hypothetical protein